MTGEIRISSPGHLGASFLAKERPFVMNHRTLSALNYPVRPAHVSPNDQNQTRGGNSPFLISPFLLSTGRKLSTDQFLNRLPKVVVKAGCVIDIRDSLRAVLQVSKDPPHSGCRLTGSVCTHRSCVFSRKQMHVCASAEAALASGCSCLVLSLGLI